MRMNELFCSLKYLGREFQIVYLYRRENCHVLHVYPKVLAAAFQRSFTSFVYLKLLSVSLRGICHTCVSL